MFLSHLLAQVAVLFFLVLGASAETHTIRFVNKCGYGYPALMQNGQNILTSKDADVSYTSPGPWSGIGYLQTGYCNTNGENCTLLETTLINAQCAGCGSSTDLSLILPHEYSVTTSFAYYGGCDGQGKTCTSENCVGDAFFQSYDNYVQVGCQVDNVNLLVSFCADAAQLVPGVAAGTTDSASSPTSSLPTTSSVPTSSLPESSPPTSSDPGSTSSTVPPAILAVPTSSATPTPTPTPTPTQSSTDTGELDCGETESPASSTPSGTPTDINDSECGGTETPTPSSVPAETPTSSEPATSTPTSTPTLAPTTPESSAVLLASTPASLPPSSVPSCRPRPLSSDPTASSTATPSTNVPVAQFRRHRRSSRIRY